MTVRSLFRFAGQSRGLWQRPLWWALAGAALLGTVAGYLRLESEIRSMAQMRLGQELTARVEWLEVSCRQQRMMAEWWAADPRIVGVVRRWEAGEAGEIPEEVAHELRDLGYEGSLVRQSRDGGSAGFRFRGNGILYSAVVHSVQGRAVGLLRLKAEHSRLGLDPRVPDSFSLVSGKGQALYKTGVPPWPGDPQVREWRWVPGLGVGLLGERWEVTGLTVLWWGRIHRKNFGHRRGIRDVKVPLKIRLGHNGRLGPGDVGDEKSFEPPLALVRAGVRSPVIN